MDSRSLSRILLLLIVSLSGVLSLKKSKWQCVSSFSNLPISTVLFLNKSNNRKKIMNATRARRLSIAAFLFIQREWQWIEVRWEHLKCVCWRCFTHLCVSLVSHCFRLFSLCRTSPLIYLQTETMATCQSWYVLLTPSVTIKA